MGGPTTATLGESVAEADDSAKPSVSAAVNKDARTTVAPNSTAVGKAFDWDWSIPSPELSAKYAEDVSSVWKSFDPEPFEVEDGKVDPVFVSEYVIEIIDYMRELEVCLPRFLRLYLLIPSLTTPGGA